MHHSLDGAIENACYIAIGANSVYDHNKWDEGHVEYILKCIKHAELLERLFQEHKDEGVPGVFAYEVCEPFGVEYGTALLTHQYPDATAIARRIVKEFFKPNQQGEADGTRT